jgi:hypothetical protein
MEVTAPEFLHGEHDLRPAPVDRESMDGRRLGDGLEQVQLHRQRTLKGGL